MKLRYIFLLALITGAVLALFIKQNNGFVVIAWENYSIEIKLWLALILAGLSALLIILLTWLFLSVKRSGKALSLWSQSRKSSKARSKTIQGLIALSEGHWAKAEQSFNQSIEQADSRLINYLLAAKAAHAQQNYVSRDNYLKLAAQHEPKASIAVSLTQSELQYESGQYELALATLTQLYGEQPKHRLVLKLLAKCYYQLKDWNKLFELFPQIIDAQVIDKKALSNIQLETVNNLLQQKAMQGSEELFKFWQRIAKDLKKNTSVKVHYVELLIKLQEYQSAEQFIRDNLKRQYRAELIYYYGLTVSDENQTQLNFAESFIKQGVNDWQLYFTLGLICYRFKLWGKAKSYLTEAANLKRTPEIFQLLLKTSNKLNDEQPIKDQLIESMLTAYNADSNNSLLRISSRIAAID
ncbi:MAG: heme biosynthesis HemY N-terminal domain-containing protein [Kangiellaceae bacterium]|jgi:HemY protein|nr:heme biosynthesis HemY N-terminal domain-containing protein [Kangiellaceae bacterium]